jgi:nascent polypeptide-associated complex subunit alpha
MPELTELDKATASMTEPRGDGSGSGTESDSDDTIPELEEPGTGQSAGVFPGASATGLPIDMVSKAKQSRGEKKARKIMSKLGLKPVCCSFKYTRNNDM